MGRFNQKRSSEAHEKDSASTTSQLAPLQMTCLHCPSIAVTRGCCMPCYQKMYRDVQSRRIGWDMLIYAGAVRRKGHKSNWVPK